MEYKFDLKEINENMIKAKNSGDEYNYKYFKEIKKIMTLPFVNIEDHPYLFYSKEKIMSLFKKVVNDNPSSCQIAQMKEAYNLFESFDIEYSIPKINIPLDEQKNLILKNLNFNNCDLQKRHDYLLNPNNHVLHISKNVPGSACYYFKGDFSKNIYVAIKKSKKFGFSELCHEIGHFDEITLLNKSLYHNYGELYSIFYELVSIDILKKENIITNDDFNSFLLFMIDVYQTYGSYFVFLEDLMHHDKAYMKKKLSFKNLLKIKTFALFDDLALYYYSFIIAYKIFLQYLQDPEKAFFNLNYIDNHINPKNEKKILTMADANPEDFSEVKTFTNKLIQRS